MHFLLNRWRRTAFHQYFEGLEPVDRITFWVATALLLAVALSFTAIVHS